MDRIDISGLWCDDITFCQENCDTLGCPRNQKNIRDRTIPHSFFVELPPDCPKRMPDYVDEQIVRHEWHGHTENIMYGPILVRCRDCKHHGRDTCSAGAGIAFPPPDDWFCADGERKENSRDD